MANENNIFSFEVQSQRIIDTIINNGNSMGEIECIADLCMNENSFDDLVLRMLTEGILTESYEQGAMLHVRGGVHTCGGSYTDRKCALCYPVI